MLLPERYLIRPESKSVSGNLDCACRAQFHPGAVRVFTREQKRPTKRKQPKKGSRYGTLSIVIVEPQDKWKKG
jgi:hypothetical protein